MKITENKPEPVRLPRSTFTLELSYREMVTIYQMCATHTVGASNGPRSVADSVYSAILALEGGFTTFPALFEGGSLRGKDQWPESLRIDV